MCSSRGKGCYNTRLKEDGGCTIWYNEMQVSLARAGQEGAGGLRALRALGGERLSAS